MNELGYPDIQYLFLTPLFFRVNENLNENLGRDSIFYHLGSHGLISFSDYVFLLTILST